MKKTLIIILAAVMAFPVASIAADAAGTTVSEQKKDKKKQSEVKDVTFIVAIDCENCVKKVRENISFEKGVKGLEISLEDQTVAVKYDAAKTSEDVLRAAIEKLGYPVSGVVEPGHEHDHHSEAEHHDHHDHDHDHGHDHHHE